MAKPVSKTLELIQSKLEILNIFKSNTLEIVNKVKSIPDLPEDFKFDIPIFGDPKIAFELPTISKEELKQEAIDYAKSLKLPLPSLMTTRAEILDYKDLISDEIFDQTKLYLQSRETGLIAQAESSISPLIQKITDALSDIYSLVSIVNSILDIVYAIKHPPLWAKELKSNPKILPTIGSQIFNAHQSDHLSDSDILYIQKTYPTFVLEIASLLPIPSAIQTILNTTHSALKTKNIPQFQFAYSQYSNLLSYLDYCYSTYNNSIFYEKIKETLSIVDIVLNKTIEHFMENIRKNKEYLQSLSSKSQDFNNSNSQDTTNNTDSTIDPNSLNSLNSLDTNLNSLNSKDPSNSLLDKNRSPLSNKDPLSNTNSSSNSNNKSNNISPNPKNPEKTPQSPLDSSRLLGAPKLSEILDILPPDLRTPFEDLRDQRLRDLPLSDQSSQVLNRNSEIQLAQDVLDSLNAQRLRDLRVQSLTKIRQHARDSRGPFKILRNRVRLSDLLAQDPEFQIFPLCPQVSELPALDEPLLVPAESSETPSDSQSQRDPRVPGPSDSQGPSDSLKPKSPETSTAPGDPDQDVKDFQNSLRSKAHDVILEFDSKVQEFHWSIKPGDSVHFNQDLGYFMDLNPEFEEPKSSESSNSPQDSQEIPAVPKYIKKIVKSPFSSAVVAEEKVLDSSFDRHFVFKNTKFMSSTNPDKPDPAVQKIQEDLNNVMSSITEDLEKMSSMEEFFDKCLFQIFTKERLLRKGASTSYIAKEWKELEKKKKNKIKKGSKYLKGLKEKDFEQSANLKNIAERSNDIKKGYIELLINRYRESLNEVINPLVNLGDKEEDKEFLEWFYNSIEYTVEEIEEEIIEEDKEDKEEKQELTEKEKLVKQIFKGNNNSEEIERQKKKEENKKKREAKDLSRVLKSLGFSQKDINIQDIKAGNLAGVQRYLDQKVEEIIKNYNKDYSSIGDISKRIEKKCEEAGLKDNYYTMDETSFFDIDILGKTFKYHKIKYTELDKDFFDSIGLGEIREDEELPDDIKDILNDLGIEFKDKINDRSFIDKATKNTIYDYMYWLKYLGMATLLGLPRLVKWFYTPPLTLPVIYLPIVVFKVPVLKVACVIGIGIAGMGTAPLIILVNKDNVDKSWLIPVTMAVDLAYQIGKMGVDGARKLLTIKGITKEQKLKLKLAGLEKAYKVGREKEEKLRKELEEYKQKVLRYVEKLEIDKYRPENQIPGVGSFNEMLKSTKEKAKAMAGAAGAAASGIAGQAKDAGKDLKDKAGGITGNKSNDPADVQNAPKRSTRSDDSQTYGGRTKNNPGPKKPAPSLKVPGAEWEEPDDYPEDYDEV